MYFKPIQNTTANGRVSLYCRQVDVDSGGNDIKVKKIGFPRVYFIDKKIYQPKVVTIDIGKREGNMMAEKESEKKIAWEIKVEAKPSLNLIRDICLTMSGSRFQRGNLWILGL